MSCDLSFAAAFLILCGLIPATVSDIRRREIPDSSLIPITAAGVINVIAVFGWRERLLVSAVLAAYLILFALITVKDPDGLGGGDMKLLLCLIPSCGAFLSCLVILSSLLLALMYGKLWRIRNMPLAPFILVGFSLCCLLTLPSGSPVE